MNELTVPTLVRSGARVAPLSFAQERLWFIDVAAPGSATYNVPIFLRWHESIAVAALRAALTAVVGKHEVLRTTYHISDGSPVQVIGDVAEIDLEVVRLGGGADAEQRLNRDAAERARQPSDLAGRPPIRCTVWQDTGGGDALLLLIHHIAVDGWSITVLLEDLADAYEAALAGRPADLPALPVQYADFAVWDRATYDDPAYRAQISGRVAELAEVSSGLVLTGRCGRPVEGMVSGTQHAFRIPQKVWTAVGELARELRATPYVVLFAAFQVVLRRWSGRSDFLVGTLTANRPHPELERLIGFFVNTVPLRCTPRLDWTFAELCRNVRGEAFRSLTYQRIPVDQLTKEVTAARGRGREGLVDVGFALQNVPAPAESARVRWAPPVQLPTGTSKFDLLLLLEERADGLSGVVEFDTDHYPDWLGQRVADDFRTLLATAVVAGTTVDALLAGLGGVVDGLDGTAEPESDDTASGEAVGGQRSSAEDRAQLTDAQRAAADLFVAVLRRLDRGHDVPDVAELEPGSNFFALGGHSLLAVTMLSEVQRRHGISVPPRDFLADATVAGLARLLATTPAPTGEDTDRHTEVTVRSDDRHPATSVQRRFWFLDRIPTLRSAYMLPTIVEYAGRIDRDVLHRALRLVLSRHPALRSRFELDRKRRELFYRTDGAPPDVVVTDGESWSDRRLADHLAAITWQPFNLVEDAPATGEIITRPDRTFVVIRAHHMVMDGWSQGVLLEQVAEAYRAEIEGRPLQLPAPVHPAVLADTPETTALRDRVADMAAELAGAPTDVALPHDRPRGDLQTTIADTTEAWLGAELTEKLRAVLGELGCTIFQATATALAVTLAERTAQRDFLFAFPWAGRRTPEVTDAVGMSVNTLVLRVDLRGEPTSRELLDRVRRASLSAYRKADVPFDKLAAELHPDRDLSRPPVTPVYLTVTDGTAVPPAPAEGITPRFLPLRPLHVKYELEVTAAETARDTRMSASFVTDLFDHDTVAELLGALVANVSGLVTDPDAPALKERIS